MPKKTENPTKQAKIRARHEKLNEWMKRLNADIERCKTEFAILKKDCEHPNLKSDSLGDYHDYSWCDDCGHKSS